MKWPTQSYFLLYMIGVLGALSGCSQGLSPNGMTVHAESNVQGQLAMSDPQILAFLPSSLSVSEQRIMYSVLASIPTRARTNVIYYDLSGIKHSNRVALQSSEVPAESRSLSRPDAVSSIPPCTSGVGSCTGVLYQHQGPIGNNFFSSTLNVPCSTTVINSNAGTDQANNYITIKGTGGAVELGIQFNANNTTPVTSVQPYFSTGHEGSFTNNPKLVCGQTNMLAEAYISQASANASAFGVMYLTAEFTSSAICGTTSSQCRAPLTMVTALPPSFDLTQVCPKCSVDWTTAIAIPTSPNQIVPGSRFALSGCSPQLSWGEVEEGRFSSAGSSAIPITSAWSSSMVAQNPSNAVSLGLVRLSSTNNLSNETIGIDETGCSNPYVTPASPYNAQSNSSVTLNIAGVYEVTTCTATNGGVCNAGEPNICDLQPNGPNYSHIDLITPTDTGPWTLQTSTGGHVNSLTCTFTIMDIYSKATSNYVVKLAAH